MSHSTRTKLIAAALLIATSTTANAAGPNREDRLYGDIQAERERQRVIIEQGRDDGSLTWYERFLLDREQARIDQLERQSLADGRLSRDEFRQIRQAQDDAARHIHNERHDPQVRGWWWRMWR